MKNIYIFIIATVLLFLQFSYARFNIWTYTRWWIKYYNSQSNNSYSNTQDYSNNNFDKNDNNDSQYNETKFENDKEYCNWNISKKFVCITKHNSHDLNSIPNRGWPCLSDELLLSSLKNSEFYNHAAQRYNQCLKEKCTPSHIYCQNYSCRKKYPGTTYGATDKMCTCINGWKFDKLSNRCITNEERDIETKKEAEKKEADIREKENIEWLKKCRKEMPWSIYNITTKNCNCDNWMVFDKWSNLCITKQKECNINFSWTTYNNIHDKCLCYYDIDWNSSWDKNTKQCPINDKLCVYEHWDQSILKWKDFCWCKEWYLLNKNLQKCEKDYILYKIIGSIILFLLFVIFLLYFTLKKKYIDLDIYKSIDIYKYQLWKTIYIDDTSLNIPKLLNKWTKLRKKWLWKKIKFLNIKWDLYYVVTSIEE